MKKDVLLFFLFAGLLFFSSSALAQYYCPPGIDPGTPGFGGCIPYIEDPGTGGEEPVCTPGPVETNVNVTDPFRCQDFAVYKCTNNSCGTDGGALDRGVMWYMCITTTSCWSDGCEGNCESVTERVSGPHGPDQVVTAFQKVPDYRICPAIYNNWGPSFPALQCSGACYPAPTQKPLSDSSLNPKNISDSSGYKLPVNFGWDDLEEIVGEADSYCSVGSYEFNISSPSITKVVLGTQLQESEAQYRLECELQSGKDYQWKVRGCLDGGGSDCGDWSIFQNFETSYSPEPYSPYDPDWNDHQTTENVDKTIAQILKWCEMENPDLYEERVFDGVLYNKPLSYKILIYKDGICHENLTERGQCVPHLLTYSKIPVPIEDLPPDEFFDEGFYFFSKDSSYTWKVAACRDFNGDDCTEYSQLWGFTPAPWDIGVSLGSPINDKNNPVGFPVILRWSSEGTNSYKYKITGVTSGTTREGNINLSTSQLSLDAVYEWFVQPCSDDQAKTCEDEWSGPWYFRTTGRPPLLISLAQNNVTMPVEFKWEEVPGAKSYILSVQGDELNKEIVAENAYFSLGYPDLKQETSYTWKVKTCAEENGHICGNYSDPQTFITFKMPAPQNASPDNTEILTGQRTKVLTWDKVSGANYYKYEIFYTASFAEESHPECVPNTTFIEEIVTQTSSSLLDLRCLGQYQWKVRACMDEKCQEAGNWTNILSFSLTEGNDPSDGGGLVPCGRIRDNPDTPWDERNNCEIKHVFLLIRNVVDFVLWTFAPLMIGILVLGTGLMFFFSIKFQNPLFLTKIKMVWKTAGIGYGILFLSWTVLNLFLRLIGFQIGIFGEWWKF